MNNLPFLRPSRTIYSRHVIKEHGPVFRLHKNTVTINSQSLGRLFARDENFFWDDEDESFRQSLEFGPLVPASVNDVKQALAEYVFKRAAAEHIPADKIRLTDSVVKAVLGVMKAKSKMPVFSHEGLFPCSSSVIRFGVDKIRELRFYPEYGFKTAGKIPYDPDAKCPKFEALLKMILPDAEDRRALLMYLGGPFTGHNLTRRMLLIRGPTGSGKSTVMKIQEALLGHDWVADLRTGLLDLQFETSHLLNSRQVSGKDVAANALSVQGAKKLKHLVGGDVTQAEVKFGGKKELTGNLFVVITSNSDLRVALENDEDAWLSRLLVLDFTKITGPLLDKGYVSQMFREEAQGIQNLFLGGGMMYLREVRKYGDIRQTPAQKLRAENLVLASKSLEVFVASKLVFSKGPDMTNDEVIKAYADFCKGRGWTPISSAVLYSQLPDLMLHKLGATKAGNVMREGVRHKGYRNVSIKAS